MKAIGFIMADELIDQLRELHAPVPDEFMHDLRCDGCSFGGWEGEPPGWPCSTARLVYSEEERAEIAEAVEWWEKWLDQMRHRNRPIRSWGILSNIQSAWEAAAGEFIADRVFPKVSVQRNEILFRREPW